MGSLATNHLKQYLESDEVLIWAGQPKKGIVFEISDIFKTIFILALFIFLYIAVKLLSEISVMIAIPIGIIFFSGGIVLGFGRFFIDAELRKKTFYGLTNKRVIITSSLAHKKIQSVYFSSKPKIEFIPNLDGTSTIDLVIKEPIGPGGGGLKWIPNIKGYTYLYRLPDGEFVHKKIKEIKDVI
jgi:hypothetical protein